MNPTNAHTSELDEQQVRELQADALRAAARRHARAFGPGFEHQLTRAWLRDQADAIAAAPITSTQIEATS